MPKLADSAKVVKTGKKTYQLFIGEDEFPWFTSTQGVRVEKGPTLTLLTVTIPVLGEVDIPLDYCPLRVYDEDTNS